MKGPLLYYRGGYKYQLSRDFEIDLNLFAPFPKLDSDVMNDFTYLSKDGLMRLRFGYAWDGCSGPTRDDKTNMRNGLIHDGGYQLMREGLIPLSYRPYFDKLLELVGIDDGMPEARAWLYREGVEHFAEKCAAKEYDPYPEQFAPGPDEPDVRPPILNE
jgi:hypothetical protein